MRTNVFRTRLLIAAIFVGLTNLENLDAQDLVVFDNGIGGAASVSAGFNADQDIPEYPADDVTLTSPKEISGIAWTGFYGFTNNVPATENFTIEIYEDTGSGAPQTGAPIATFNPGNSVNRVDSGNNINFLGTQVDVFNYFASINFSMDANKTYWISVYSDSVGHGDDFRWAGSNGGGNQHSSATSGSSWAFGGHQVDFRLLESPVYDNGIMGAANVSAGFNADQDIPEFAVDDVSLFSTTRVTNVAWTGFYGFTNNVPATEDFRISIFADNGSGTPQTGMPIETFNVGNAVNRADSGNDINFLGTQVDVFNYSADINFTMQAGVTYWIGIYNDSAGNVDDFRWAGANGGGNQNSTANSGGSWAFGGHQVDFRLFGFGSPANDDWNGTISLGGFPIMATGTNFGASTQADEQEVPTTGSTVWWFFNAPDDGMVTIDTFGSDFDTQLYIFDGFNVSTNFADLNPIIGNDDAPDAPPENIRVSKVEFAVTAGTCYEVRVGGWHTSGLPAGGIGDEGNIVLNGTFEPGGVLLGDVNCDGAVNLLDVAPFVDLVSNGGFSVKADINEDGSVNLLDVQPFVALLSGG